jgi:hypothetical protein
VLPVDPSRSMPREPVIQGLKSTLSALRREGLAIRPTSVARIEQHGPRAMRRVGGPHPRSIDFRSGVPYRPRTEMATSFWYRSPA